jgi:hypothetical protein
MIIEELQMQLRRIEPEYLDGLLASKVKALDMLAEDKYLQIHRVKEEVGSIPILQSIATTVSGSFATKNQEYLEAFKAEAEEEVVEAYENAGVVPGEVFERLADMFDFGVILACLAIKSFAELADTEVQDAAQPSLIEDTLIKIDDEAADTVNIIKSFCHRAFDEPDGVSVEEFGYEYPALGMLTSAIGACAVKAFEEDSHALQFAGWGSTATFAVLTKIIDTEVEKVKQEEQIKETEQKLLISEWEAFMNSLG